MMKNFRPPSGKTFTLRRPPLPFFHPKTMRRILASFRLTSQKQSLWGFPGNQRVLKNAPPTRARGSKCRALRYFCSVALFLLDAPSLASVNNNTVCSGDFKNRTLLFFAKYFKVAIRKRIVCLETCTLLSFCLKDFPPLSLSLFWKNKINLPFPQRRDV